VPRGGIEFASTELKQRNFSNDNSPVYPSVYPAFSAGQQPALDQSAPTLVPAPLSSPSPQI
jgi:hypothetical protein